VEQPADMTFYHLGDLALPGGMEGKELHFFIARGRVEVWLLPPDPPPGLVEQWLDDRRRSTAQGPDPCVETSR